MLEQRQPVLLGQLRLIQEPLQETVFDGGPERIQRPCDGRFQVRPGHLGQQICTVIDRLRQAVKQRAIAQVLGAHRQDDIERGRARLRAGRGFRHGQEQLDKKGRFIPVGRLILLALPGEAE